MTIPLSDVAVVGIATMVIDGKTTPIDDSGQPLKDGLFLSNYATLKLRDELSRVYGVGDVLVRGVGAYSMRVWTTSPPSLSTIRQPFRTCWQLVSAPA